ncbi:TetR/AcrR family transcriptional regulator [Paeniroseomonas aquatica]|jgi:AcrR family transcriptional regulator|uniref:TetR/AcrR family transcriptional regulator n=1 Tax=Paeniroseomonas aquatica TaxID=373043 RepID=A0ABT8A7A1_9PROT|nr:TetR/AcrR family transcriptional regulator [Paeniroseomonas aquatica]MDN3565617.1 TetR/AcrR family transcriptional regulator [Paeniroseomonas aquatica]
MDGSSPALSPRAAATRQRILDAALGEFAAKGLAGARVDEIALRAGANKRMLYAHFGSKEELWLVVLEGAYAAKRAEERALQVDALPPAAAMQRLVEFNLRYTAAHPEFVALLNQENIHRAAYLKRSAQVPALYSPLLEQIQAVLERGVATGIFRAGVDPMQLYVTILSLGHFYLANIHTLSTIFGAGLGTEAALRAREAHGVAVVLGYLRP